MQEQETRKKLFLYIVKCMFEFYRWWLKANGPKYNTTNHNNNNNNKLEAEINNN